MMARITRYLTVLLCTLLAAQHAYAEDYFFTFGGGYSPQGNQVSLEKNVQFFRKFLADTGHKQSPQFTLFADGDDPARDLQYAQSPESKSELHYLLADVFGQTKDLYNRYRSNVLTDLDGACTPQGVEDYFSRTASTLQTSDRLFVYYTGHGGKGEKDAPYNTVVHLWDNQNVRMKEFIKHLDKVPPHVPVVMVMVQCYSGGYSHVIFNEGDSSKGLSPHNRAGFFATVHDRVAAGCTPDINEENYEEYSTYFWAALYGQTRLGRTIDRPDFDGDGRVCFAEAHAYALIHSDSIDISVKTTDALLRAFSTTDPNKDQDNPRPELMTENAAYSELLACADPYEKAVMEGLSAVLSLGGEQRTQAARDLAEDAEKKRKELHDERAKLMTERNNIRNDMAAQLKKRWPEIANPWHPVVQRVLTREAKAATKIITGHPQYSRFLELSRRVNEIDDQRLELERQWAKCKRFIRAAENVALVTNLPALASPEVCDRYNQLFSAECGRLGGD